MHFPISLDRLATPPVAPVTDSAESFRDARQRQSSDFIYRGELLETVSDKSYRPAYNLQISPENQRAINSYQKVVNEAPVVGRILDGFI